MTLRAPIIPINSADDPRIAAYTQLKERDLARQGDRFIAEGELVVRRLLSSEYRVESVLLADRRAAEIAPLVPPSATVFTAPAAVVNQIVGFKFHAGVMAVAIRGPSPTIESLAPTLPPRLTLVVVPEIANTENLGGMIRIAAAFGANAMILGEHCCDPFYRQSVRVSMGTIFSIPIIRSENLAADLRMLRDHHGVELIATLLDESAEPLSAARRPNRIAILFGNEAQGLCEAHVALCQRRVTIPMARGIDSLNVSIAAGIVLYHFTQYAPSID